MPHALNCPKTAQPSHSLLKNEKAAIGDKEGNTEYTLKPENGDREYSPGQTEIQWDAANEAKRSSFPFLTELVNQSPLEILLDSKQELSSFINTTSNQGCHYALK